MWAHLYDKRALKFKSSNYLNMSPKVAVLDNNMKRLLLVGKSPLHDFLEPQVPSTFWIALGELICLEKILGRFHEYPSCAKRYTPPFEYIRK